MYSISRHNVKIHTFIFIFNQPRRHDRARCHHPCFPFSQFFSFFATLFSVFSFFHSFLSFFSFSTLFSVFSPFSTLSRGQLPPCLCLLQSGGVCYSGDLPRAAKQTAVAITGSETENAWKLIDREKTNYFWLTTGVWAEFSSAINHSKRLWTVVQNRKNILKNHSLF